MQDKVLRDIVSRLQMRGFEEEIIWANAAGAHAFQIQFKLIHSVLLPLLLLLLLMLF